LGEIDIDGTTHTLIDVASGGSLNIANGDLEGTLQTIRAAMNQVATQRGTIGAFQKNTVASQISTNQVAFENVAAANSLIRDTDYAKETAALSRAQVLEQSSIGVMSMINFIRQQVMNALMG